MRERIVNELAAATRAGRRSLLADRHMGAVAARPDSTRRCAAMHDARDEIVIGAVLRIRALRDTIARSAAALALPTWSLCVVRYCSLICLTACVFAAR